MQEGKRLTKYHPSKDIPKIVRELKTFSPTKIRAHILAKRNKAVTPESITMWFKRNPEIKAQLQKEIIEQEKPQEVVFATIFQNGTFEELPTVKQWKEEMEDRHLSPKYIDKQIGCLKRVCKGHKIKNPVLKHPDRLTLEEARAYLRELRKTIDTHDYRIALRDFLLSKGITVGKKISGSAVSGKYAKLHLPKPLITEFLNIVRDFNYEAFVIDLFVYKTGTRIGFWKQGTLGALIENISQTEEYRTIRVFDKGRRSKYPDGHPWDKYIDSELWSALQKQIGDRQIGRIFQMREDEVRDLNKATLKIMMEKHKDEPKTVWLLEQCYQIPTHFLRHQFFQHCLVATDWNMSACASLGGSTTMSLEQSYGQPPEAVVKKWGLEVLPNL